MRPACHVLIVTTLILATMWCGVSATGEHLRPLWLPSVRSLIFRAGENAVGRRGVHPKLECVAAHEGPNAVKYHPSLIECRNIGTKGPDVEWDCSGQTHPDVEFDEIDVICEGFENSRDDYVTPGSCLLVYTLRYRATARYTKMDWPTMVMAVVLVCVMLYVQTRVPSISRGYDSSLPSKPPPTASSYTPPVAETPTDEASSSWSERSHEEEEEESASSTPAPAPASMSTSTPNRGFLDIILHSIVSTESTASSSPSSDASTTKTHRRRNSGVDHTTTTAVASTSRREEPTEDVPVTSSGTASTTRWRSPPAESTDQVIEKPTSSTAKTKRWSEEGVVVHETSTTRTHTKRRTEHAPTASSSSTARTKRR